MRALVDALDAIEAADVDDDKRSYAVVNTSREIAASRDSIRERLPASEADHESLSTILTRLVDPA